MSQATLQLAIKGDLMDAGGAVLFSQTESLFSNSQLHFQKSLPLDRRNNLSFAKSCTFLRLLHQNALPPQSCCMKLWVVQDGMEVPGVKAHSKHALSLLLGRKTPWEF